MPRSGRNIIVVGASAGGLDVLDELIGQLPSDIPATLFVVQHLPPHSKGDALISRLRKHRSFDCKLAENGERFKKGRVYIGPADYHLLVKKQAMLVTKGARENRYRPAIDPLFRSAAVMHGPRVIGVLLTGMLDDGTVGLSAIQRCGGVTVVQDPNDAAYREMPESALQNLKVDHVVPVSAMGRLLDNLARGRPGRRVAVPADVAIEATIAERVLSDVAQVNGLGAQVPYNCPNCGGVLWEITGRGIDRYRCHTGHSYTTSSLLVAQTERVEETLWIALRMLEERKNLMNSRAQNEKRPRARASYARRVRDTEMHIERIRAMLLSRSRAPTAK